jgi:glycerol kinase
MAPAALLGIDAGTTGVTVILYDEHLRPTRRGYEEFKQHYPKPGWVEHDATEIRDVVLRLVREVTNGGRDRPVALGITNQRETVLAMDRSSGEPLSRAIVWQCRRTTDRCRALRAKGVEDLVRVRTGLLLDPYFSATKMAWLLEHVPAVGAAAADGRLVFTTIDAFLVHVLTGGRVCATDPTNASRTLVFDIHRRSWDEELLALFGVTASMLPEVRPSAGDFGMTDPRVVGFEAPLAGVAGDQQAALFGQGCLDPGTAKNTYGTGCFFLVNAGVLPPEAPSGILTTLAVGRGGEAVYALEGSVFIAGAVMQWLRDELGLIDDAAESEALARAVEDTGGVYVVPAFSGLGAPHWDPGARGLICGLTRGTGRAHVVRAALESIAYQTADLHGALAAATRFPVNELRVDGGGARNDWLLQFQADLLDVPVSRGQDLETTCRGAALLAGLGAGVVADPGSVAALTDDRELFVPAMAQSDRSRLLAGWRDAVARARSAPETDA